MMLWFIIKVYIGIHLIPGTELLKLLELFLSDKSDKGVWYSLQAPSSHSWVYVTEVGFRKPQGHLRMVAREPTMWSESWTF